MVSVPSWAGIIVSSLAKLTREELTGAGGCRRPVPLTVRGGWAARRRSGRRRWTQTLALHLIQTLPVLVVFGQVLHETWQAGEGCGGTDAHTEVIIPSETVFSVSDMFSLSPFL